MARAFRSGGPRRVTQWGGLGNQDGSTVQRSTFVSGASGVTIILSSGLIVGGGYGFVEERVTITRLIGSFAARIQPDTSGLAAAYAMGCAKARVEAITAGVGSLPSPESQPDFEWLYYHAGNLRRDGTANTDNGLTTIRVEFDVRSQRILHSGESLVWLCSIRTNAVEAAVGGRALVKLA